MSSGNDLICSSTPGDPEPCSSTSREGAAVRRTQASVQLPWFQVYMLVQTLVSGWSPLRTHLERTRRRPKKHKIGMQHIQINKWLQFETLAQSRGHSHASESLASLAWRNISGIADCARWRSGVVFVAFPCLFPSHIVTTASHSSECAQICGESLGRCSPWWCPPTLAHFGAAR